MQRWTDHIRPFDFTVLGHAAQSMTASWVIGRSYEGARKSGPSIRELDWPYLVEACIFDLLARSVTADLKSQVYRQMVKDDDARYAILGKVIDVVVDCLTADLGVDASRMAKNALAAREEGDRPERRVHRASTAFATRWEKDLLDGFQPPELELPGEYDALHADESEYADLLSAAKPNSHDWSKTEVHRFLSLCGRLRFQDRWSQTPIIPRRPVLDHQGVVAVLAYLVSLESGLPPSECVDAFYRGLFHDIGEIGTRDVISNTKNMDPVIDAAIRRHEEEQFREHILVLLPQHWRNEMASYVLQPFDAPDHPASCAVVQACDDFSAFMEAYYSIAHGTTSSELRTAVRNLAPKLAIADGPFAQIVQTCASEVG